MLNMRFDDEIFLSRPFFNDSVNDRLMEVVKSKHWTEGKMVNEFEKAVAEIQGVEFAIAVPNATIGLQLAIEEFANTKKKRNEVIVPAYTHPATALAVQRAGLKPVFADVDLETMLITEESIRKRINRRTAAIVTVSMFGNLVDCEWMMNLGLDVPIIEDAACSIGSRFTEEKMVEPDVSVLSFHPRKIISTGEGGMILTNDEKQAIAIRRKKNFGAHGSNYKMSDIQAAIGYGQLPFLKEIIERRRQIAERYIDELLFKFGEVRTQKITSNCRTNYQSFVVRVERMQHVWQVMRANHVEANIASTPVSPRICEEKINTHKCFNAIELYKTAMVLPMHHELSDTNVDDVIETFEFAWQEVNR